MSRVRPSSPPTGLLAAAVTATATSLTFPAGTYTAMDRPRQMFVSSVELVNVTAVTTGSPETWTVVRGVDGTTAVAHDLDATVERVYPLSEVVYQPAAKRISTTVNGTLYVPDANFKYHFITLAVQQTNAWTIAAPTKAGGAIEAGDELRFWFKQPAKAMTTVQPTWDAVYDRTQTGGTALRTLATTASSVTSFSFAWDGTGTAPGALGSWHLIS